MRVSIRLGLIGYLLLFLLGCRKPETVDETEVKHHTEAIPRAVVPREGKGNPLLIVCWPSPKNLQIFRVNTDGTERKPLTSKDTFAADPALSPDGTRIAFVGSTEEEKDIGLFVMNADGTGRKRLAEIAEEPLAPSWSPDGKRIAFCTVEWSFKSPSLKPRLYVVDADGQNLKRLEKADGMMPSWSPDGKQLLFIREENQGSDATSLCVVDADGTNVHQLVKNGPMMGAWSPDGKSLAYVVIETLHVRGEVAGLFVARADGSEPKKLIGGPRKLTFGVQWSADGKRLFFTSQGPGKVVGTEGARQEKEKVVTPGSAVYVIDVDGRNLRRVTTGNDPEYLGGTFLLARSLYENSSPPENPPLDKEVKSGSATDDDKAAQWIEDIGGGKVTRDKEQKGRPIIIVDLARTLVKDADLKHLAGLKALQFLDLERTAVTDAGLKDLAALKNLQYLTLTGTKVSGAGLKDLTGLQYLNLDSTGLTDAELKNLAGIKNLKQLVLHRTAVTDAGLRELAGLKNLTQLELDETRITDAGLKELANHKNLTLLYLRDTKVTSAGVAELRKALPKCTIPD